MPFFILLMFITQQTMIDFGIKKDGSDWRTVNDSVMGGVSNGSHQLSKDALEFSGKISFDNNGGFSSVRGPYGDFDFSSYDKVSIRYSLEGLDMALTLERERPYYKPKFRVTLPKTGGGWTTAEWSLDEFKEYVVGRATGRTISKDQLASIIRIGFINSEKAEKNFSMKIDYISFQ